MTEGLGEEAEAEEKPMTVLQGPEGDVSFRLLLNSVRALSCQFLPWPSTSDVIGIY